MNEKQKSISNRTRILWINPLNFTDYDQPMGDYINSIKNDGTELEVVSFNSNAKMNNLEYRTYEALIVGDTVKVARYAAEQGFDAAVIGCFYDPAIEDAREISGETVIVGPCQASIQIAANLCNRFSVIIGQEKWAEQMTERVRSYGYGSKLASMRSIDTPVHELQKDCDVTAARIIDAGRKAVDIDKAEALVLGCTCTFGLYETVQKELGVPVIDPIVASFKMAEYLGSLKRQFGWVPSRKWSCEAPPEEHLREFGLFAGPPPIANKLNYS